MGEVRVKSRRLAVFALLATAFASGCRSNGFGTLTKPTPIAAPVPGLDPEQLIARHNREARLITSYQASPSVTPKNKSGRKNVLLGVAHGSLYIEPPRNFRLVLKALQREVVDVGSNEDKLWIWSESLGSDVFTCSYDDSGAVPVSGLYQPDWIMEALGLEALPEPGTEGVQIRKDANNADLVIEQKRTGGDGNVAIKETVFSGLDGKISEHRLYQFDANGKKTLVASARIQRYESHAVATPGEEGEPSTIELPAVVAIHWPAEQMDLEVQLSSVKLNAGFSKPQASRYFTVPERGKQRDLREALGQVVEPDGPTTRETRPAPPTGVRLSEPIPAAAAPRRVGRSAMAANADPAVAVAGNGDDATAPHDQFVGGGVPRPAKGVETGQVYTEWRGSQGRPIRR